MLVIGEAIYVWGQGIYGKSVHLFFKFAVNLTLLLFFKRFYLFIFREREREGEREGNIDVWLPLARPLLGTWPATQACALDWESNQ